MARTCLIMLLAAGMLKGTPVSSAPAAAPSQAPGAEVHHAPGAAPSHAPGVAPRSAGLPASKELRNGWWRARLLRPDGNEIVFNFEVKDSAGKKVLYIRNAGERMLVDDLTRKGDSLIIRLPFFESELWTVLTAEGRLEGVWVKRGASKYATVPFVAIYGEEYRFPQTAANEIPRNNVSGRWKALFISPNGKDSSVRIGEFVQQGSRVTGTFLDPTGDFRYLEGIVSGDTLLLSTFDGGHAFLFRARIEGGEITGGQFYSGAGGQESWTAVKDASAALPDEFNMVKWNKDAGPLQFSFRDTDGKTVSLSDERFKNKVVLIQIMGSWCPNCMDETAFLSGFYDEYRHKGVEIIGLAYERSTDFARSQASLRGFQQRFQVKYPVLITGVTVGDPDRAKKTLPQLDKIAGFPTTIFLDRKGNIYKIHTGFSGPGTGEHYEEQKREIRRVVDELL